MSGANAKARGQMVYSAIIEGASIDQTHRAVNRRPRSFPGRRERGSFGPATQARPVSSRFGSRCGWIELDVAAPGRPYWANGATINPRGAYAGKETAVICRVPADASTFAFGNIEHGQFRATESDSGEFIPTPGVKHLAA
jgi:hypothetical protein